MKKFIIGCICVTVTVAAIAAFGIWYWLIRETPTLGAALSVPMEVQTGATFTLTITTTNSHNQPVTLDSIDIDDSFLAGFQVVTIVPEPGDTSHLQLLNQRSWVFDKAVAPGGTLSVTFTLKAIADGHFTGDVDVCNPAQDFKTFLADVLVMANKPDKADKPAVNSRP